MTTVRRWIARLMSPNLIIWFKKFRRGQHTWQPKHKRFLAQIDKKEQYLDSFTLVINNENSVVIKEGFDSLKNAKENFRLVSFALKNHKVEHVQLPNPNPYNARIVVKAKDRVKAVAAIESLHATSGWNKTFFELQDISQDFIRVRDNNINLVQIEIYRNFVSNKGVKLSSQREKVIIEFWDVVGAQIPRNDGGYYTPGTAKRPVSKRETLLEYITPELWEEAQADGNKVSFPSPHIYQETEKIDVVYTWVDGEDPSWVDRKNDAFGRLDISETNETATSHSRFANRDELRYSLRSIEAYASWVNHIYIVTDRQVPSWLDTSHPKISVVDHSEIFKHPTLLPVFNSHAIESQLHRIPGLSERYLYMNDDILFMSPVNQDTFFTSSGLSKFFPSTAPLDFSSASANDLPVLSAAKNGRDFIEKVHGRFVTNKFKHTPHPQLKSVLDEFEDKHPEVFEKVSASVFRHPEDYSIPSSLYHYYAYGLQKAVIGSIRYEYLDISVPDAAKKLEKISLRENLQVLCLNDTHLDPSKEDQVGEVLRVFMESKFPVPSSFEKLN